MNSPVSNTGPSASDRSKKGELVLNLQTARRMLPLVRHIIEDILHTRQELARKQPEQHRLDRQRHTLDWPARSRRYQLREEISAEERHLQEAQAELERLGVVLLDPAKGQVGFPTLVNGRRAFFSWRPSEEALRHWHFVGEKVRRLIPAAWNLEPANSVIDQS
jgi:hypothetical protein